MEINPVYKKKLYLSIVEFWQNLCNRALIRFQVPRTIAKNDKKGWKDLFTLLSHFLSRTQVIMTAKNMTMYSKILKVTFQSFYDLRFILTLFFVLVLVGFLYLKFSFLTLEYKIYLVSSINIFKHFKGNVNESFVCRSPYDLSICIKISFLIRP